MLKWAVNGSHIRHSQLHQTIPFEQHQDLENNNHVVENSNLENSSINQRRSLSNVTNIKREKLRRKSSGHELTNIRRKILINNKENHLTSSTPLPLTKQLINNSNSPLRKLDSLKDLSNITTESFMILTTPNQTPTKQKYYEGCSGTDINLVTTTPNTLTKNNNNPLQYATTLPTFDVEYSPCGIIPGPLLALRGISIADSYFEKPRYLPHEFPGYRKRTNENCNQDFDNTKLKNSKNLPPAKRFHAIDNIDDDNKRNDIGHNNNNNDESLSSSKMGDTTLDKMIDAILESARKDRRLPKSKNQQLHIMSPTYTPADDPASDLNEFWDEPNSIYRQNDTTKIKNYNFDDPGGTIIYNEREIRSPNYYINNILENLPSTSTTTTTLKHNNNLNDNNMSCHLRRQRAVRRKRKLSIASTNFIKSTVKNSAHKLFTSHLRKNHNNNNDDQLLDNQQQKRKKPNDNFSPDSGRNSASDFDDSTDENHCTKRRLSFSPV